MLATNATAIIIGLMAATLLLSLVVVITPQANARVFNTCPPNSQQGGVSMGFDKSCGLGNP